LYLILLFLAGAFLFRQFLYYQGETILFQDWTEVTLPRLTFLKNAVSNNLLPLHSATELFMGNIRSTRYLAIPDAILSPQIVLLKWVSIDQFIQIHAILIYSLGFLGLLALQRKFKLSPLTFTIFFVFFFFNGHILAHLSIGHLTWASCFLFSWFILIITDLLDGKGGWKWIAQMAGFLFLMLLEGGYHQVVYCLIFMGLLALFVPEKFWVLSKAAIAAVLLGAVRLMPEISLLGNFNTIFLAGYSNILTIWNGLVSIEKPGISILIENTVKKIGLWEVTFFVGGVGAIFILYFGFVAPLSHKNAGAPHAYTKILAPVLGIVLLSMQQSYRFLRMLVPLPIFTGERVASRMIIVAFVLILLLAALEFQTWLDSRKDRRSSLALSLIILGIGLNDLYQNFLTWKLTNSSTAFPVENFVPGNWSVANNLTDSLYLNLVVVGLVITIVTAVFLFTMIWRDQHPHLKITSQN